MFFRALTLFRFPAALDFTHLDEGLADCALKPVGPLELQSRGFVPPLPTNMEGARVSYSHRVERCIWLALGGEDRVIPAAAVNEALRKKVAEVEHAEGRKLGGRARKRLRDELIIDMLPRAFIKPGRANAYIDLKRRFLAVDTTSRKVAENVVSEIRRALGSFPALPVNSSTSPRGLMTGWIANVHTMPTGFVLGDECELKDPSDRGAIVKCQRQELQGEEVDKHLQSGKQVTRLALAYDDHVSFVFGEDLVVRKLKFLDGAAQSLESMELESIAAELDARFALMTGEVGELFDMLDGAFDFNDADDGTAPAKVKTPFKSLRAGETVLVTASGAQQNANPGLDDPLYQSAIGIVRAAGNASISHLQRRLSIGYNRAARMIEAMEACGVVTPPTNDGSRTVVPV